MGSEVHITEAGRRLSVSAGLLRRLEREAKIPCARRDHFGARVYSEVDLALLRAIGVGRRPSRLRRVEDVLGVLE